MNVLAAKCGFGQRQKRGFLTAKYAKYAKKTGVVFNRRERTEHEDYKGFGAFFPFFCSRISRISRLKESGYSSFSAVIQVRQGVDHGGGGGRRGRGQRPQMATDVSPEATNCAILALENRQTAENEGSNREIREIREKDGFNRRWTQMNADGGGAKNGGLAHELHELTRKTGDPEPQRHGDAEKTGETEALGSGLWALGGGKKGFLVSFFSL
jgi:hypothetical protein